MQHIFHGFHRILKICLLMKEYLLVLFFFALVETSDYLRYCILSRGQKFRWGGPPLGHLIIWLPLRGKEDESDHQVGARIGSRLVLPRHSRSLRFCHFCPFPSQAVWQFSSFNDEILGGVKPPRDSTSPLE